MKTTTRKKMRENALGWALILPSVIFIALFTLYPLVLSGRNSLYRNNLSTVIPRFAGFENYQGLVSDRVFLKTIGNTALFTAVTVPLCMAAALALALLLRRAGKWVRPVLRFAWFYPTVIPLVAVANLWLFIYTPDYGLLSAALSRFGIPGRNWLGNPQTVMPALMVLYLWKQSGYFMIFFLAGLQQIDKDIQEAARIDGAGAFASFWRITLPLLMPTILFVFIISATASFKTVDHLVIMTRGGPDNASNLLLYYIYETAFSFWDLGKADAMTVTLIAMMSLFIAANLRYFDKRIHYQGGHS